MDRFEAAEGEMDSCDLQTLGGLPRKTLGNVGGAAGILFDVIMFVIQYQDERLDKTVFLVRYLRRREGLIRIAAFIRGVVAANAVVSMPTAMGVLPGD